MVRAMRTLFLGLVLLSSCAKKTSGYTVTGTAELSPVHEVSTIAAKLDLTEVNGEKDVEIKGTVTGMEPGTYVLHYHQPMGCDPMAAHPTDLHISDLGSIQADANGAATVRFTIKNARLGGMTPITSNCLVVYSADGTKFLAYGKIHGQPLGIGH